MNFLFNLLSKRQYDRIMQELENIKTKINMTAQQTVEAIKKVAEKLEKANTEIQGAITDLKEQIENADVPQGITDALAALETSAQTLDDIVPDVVTPPEPPTA